MSWVLWPSPDPPAGAMLWVVNATSLSAAVLVITALSCVPASAYEPMRQGVSKPQLPDPRLDDPKEFGRYADAAPKLRDNAPPPVFLAERVMSRGATLPMIDRRISMPRAIPRPAEWSRAAAPGEPVVRMELARSDPRTPLVSSLTSLTQHAGVALLLLGLTGPLRRAAERRRRGQTDVV